MDSNERLGRIDKMLQEMSEQEEKLWFFDNEEQIDVQLEKISSEVKEKKLTRRQQKAIDDAYIPPEIKATRN